MDDAAWRITVEHIERGVTCRSEFTEVEMGALRTHMFGRGNDLNPWGRALLKLRMVLGRDSATWRTVPDGDEVE